MKRKEFINKMGLVTTGGFFYDKIKLKGLLFDRKVRVGLIGVNGMGWSDLQALLKVSDFECTALCDIDERILKKRVIELRSHREIKTFTNYKDMLKEDLVDVVIVGTPDHWHCLQFLDLLTANKDIYIEKPIGHTIEECQIMAEAITKSDNIVQVGQWQRSQQHFRDAIEFVHSGALGRIRLVKAWAYQGWMGDVEVKEDSNAPEGVHYDMWLGPAPKRKFNENRFHFDFRWFWDYAGGLMTDWGVHMLDYALFGMKADYPNSIVASGGKFAYPNDASETPDTLTALYEFDDFTIQWEHATSIDLGPYRRNHGVAFIGNKGTLVVNRDGWEVIPEKDKMEAIALQEKKDDGLEEHMRNFIKAIERKDKTILNAPVEVGTHVGIVAEMGNIAYKVQEKLHWKDGEFVDNPRANELIRAQYHNGYSLHQI